MTYTVSSGNVKPYSTQLLCLLLYHAGVHAQKMPEQMQFSVPDNTLKRVSLHVALTVSLQPKAHLLCELASP